MEKQEVVVLDRPTIANPRRYVQWWFTVLKKCTLRQAKADSSWFGTMYIDYNDSIAAYRHAHEARMNGIGEKLLQYAFNEYLKEELDKERVKAVAKFKCTGENLDPLKAWLKAITGTENDITTTILAHWCWLIKRKSYDLPVKHHIMPVLYGQQGSGKTEAINKLIKPYQEFVLDMKTDALEDKNNYEAMSQHLIIFFDELQGIERTDLNVLKHQITTSVNSYRKYYTQSMLTVPQRCSFIGATNRPLNENFSDATGQRRFFEITTLAKTDWNAINAMDYDALWLGIDENKPNGYLTGDALTKAEELQKLLVNKESLEIFVEETLMLGGERQRALSALTIYNHYVAWSASAGEKALGRSWFTRKLANRGVPMIKQRGSNKVLHAFFTVNEDCIIKETANEALLKVVSS